jgi:hypothetical protein
MPKRHVAPKTSPVADRVRAEALRLGVSLRKLSADIGWHETQLGVILRRLDEGGNIRSDAQEELARGLGWSVQKLMTGEESAAGVTLETLPEWPEARKVAEERYRISTEALDAVARWRVPHPPPRIDAAFVVALARAWQDAGGSALDKV